MPSPPALWSPLDVASGVPNLARRVIHFQPQRLRLLLNVRVSELHSEHSRDDPQARARRRFFIPRLKRRLVCILRLRQTLGLLLELQDD